ncbi:hypothetical protein [Nonomuraea sp. NPDC003214]
MLSAAVPSVVPPAALERPPRARRRFALPSLLVAGFVAQVLVRLWLSRYHAGPVANPDETGYLAGARWLAGGPAADFSGTTFYRGGYPLLLAPIHWLTSDPATVYRLVVVAGSVAAATAFPLAYLLLRRFGIGRRGALALGFAAALAPPGLLFSGLALADAILPSIVLAWLLAVHDLVRRGPGRLGAWAGARAGVLAGALAAYATAVHLRGTVVLAVLVVLMAGLVLARRGYGTAVLPGALVAAAVAAAGWALNAAVSAALYPRGPRDLTALLVSRLTTPDGQAWALSGAAGQLWYLIAGTWGLAGVGLAGAAVVAVRRGPLAGRVTAAALLAVTLGIAYASSAALPDEHRVGNYAYGRYLSCVAVAWMLAGLLVLVRARRAAALRHVAASAVLLAATGGVAAWYAGDRLRRYAYIAFDFPETSFLSGVRDALDLVATFRAALILLACLAAACLFARRRTRIVVATAVLAAVHVAFAADLAPKAPPAPATGWLHAPPPGGGFAVDTRVHWGIWVPLTHRVWWTALDLYDGRKQGPPPGACSALVPEDAGPPPAGWVATGEGGKGHGWTAWRDPACPASPRR